MQEKPTINESNTKKIARLELYIQRLENIVKNIEADFSKNKISPFSEEQIKLYLSTCPDFIADAGILLADFQRCYEYAKADTQTVWAELWYECNQKREVLNLTNAEDRKSWVKIQPGYKTTLEREIDWKYQVQRMQVIYERYQNLFTATRKIANFALSFNQMQENIQV